MAKESEETNEPVRLCLPVLTVPEGNGLEDQIYEELRKRKLTITTAESCTGGLIAGRLINVSGASNIIERGFVTYSNLAKEEELGVRHETLERYGAVSSQTVIEMAKGAARHGKAQIAVAVTGLAGPEGGTPEKPVGLVYIGIDFSGKLYWQEYRFQGNRNEIRELTVVNSLNLLKHSLLRQE